MKATTILATATMAAMAVVNAYGGDVLNGNTSNTADGVAAVVAGGTSNEADGFRAFIGAGWENLADGSDSVITGGIRNQTIGAVTVVGGGAGNVARGEASTVIGGFNNLARGRYSVVLGGQMNQALGDLSVAAGKSAMALHGGSMVLSDSSIGSFESQVTNELAGRFTGGVRFATTRSKTGEMIGASLRPNSTSWAVNCSEANVVLERQLIGAPGNNLMNDFMAMPIHRWLYTGLTGTVMHVGPTAEVFIGAFSDDLNYDTSPEAMADDSINVMDAIGVTMVSLQEFYRANQADSALLWEAASATSAEANTATLSVQQLQQTVDAQVLQIQQLQTDDAQQATRMAQLEAEFTQQAVLIEDLVARVTALEGSGGKKGGGRK
ncbi:MAG: hypothetical protein O7H40_07590 [Gammaproteobacteria bacterium]|nr:hypothetical protein [Gammaproteobacteria bacterium]